MTRTLGRPGAWARFWVPRHAETTMAAAIAPRIRVRRAIGFIIVGRLSPTSKVWLPASAGRQRAAFRMVRQPHPFACRRKPRVVRRNDERHTHAVVVVTRARNVARDTRAD